MCSFNFTDSANIGKAYKDFVLLAVDEIKDFKAKGVYLRHKITGLEVYHIIKEDKENLFAYAFRTLDKTSRGAQTYSSAFQRVMSYLRI